MAFQITVITLLSLIVVSKIFGVIAQIKSLSKSAPTLRELLEEIDALTRELKGLPKEESDD